MSFFGSGILKGMGVTLKNFMTSYFRPKFEKGGLFTAEYPEKPLPKIENFRNLPFLVYDGEPENIRCTACDICAKECPPKCIYIVREFDEAGKPLKRPAIFDVDASVCMNCGICEEACPFDSIYMDNHFEIASTNRQSELLLQKNDLLRSNDYFHSIRPADATAIDEKRKAAEEKKKAVEAARAKAAADKATEKDRASGLGTRDSSKETPDSKPEEDKA